MFRRVRPYFRKHLGQVGEALATLLLQQKGYRLWERNWSQRWGEIDIILTDGDTLVFVEVKSRLFFTRLTYDPVDSVGTAKMRKLTRLAQAYVSRNTARLRRERLSGIRFDIVGITIGGAIFSPLRVRHLKGAFNESSALSAFFLQRFNDP